MVSPPRIMMPIALCTFAALFACPPRAAMAQEGEGSDGASEVREALRSKGYHWYDVSKDAIRSITPPPPPKPKPQPTSSGGSGGGSSSGSFKFPDLGTALLYLLGAICVAALIAGLIYGLRRLQPRKPGADGDGESGQAKAGPARYESLDLAESLGPIDSDPYTHAARLRDRGDLAGAIIWLFVHIVLTLDERQLVRLVPGRTGRQIVRSVEDREVRGEIEPVLRLFEAAFYGHHAPDPEAFSLAWERAEAFLGDRAGGGRPQRRSEGRAR